MAERSEISALVLQKNNKLLAPPQKRAASAARKCPPSKQSFSPGPRLQPYNPVMHPS